ncbi:MAG: T9SS type A sorting domain-containing protein [Bacteroidales bacterium]|nr:T9SS type A sorting domain-containing protein [Bacteroidales bacterium]
MKTKSIVATIIFVFLLHFLTIAQETMRIKPNTKITIELGTTMYIATGNLVLESDATGDVSLIVLGALEIYNSGKTIAERYLPGGAQTWHLLSAPVSGMAISGSGFNPGGDDDFYAWHEPSPGTWVNYKNSDEPAFNTINNGDNFVSGSGYLIAYNSANPTKTFTGDLNTGDIAFNLKNSGSKSWTYSSGWNLIGNPYSSSIDWNLADRSQFQDDYAYVYDANKSGGAGYIPVNGGNANAYIGSNQGFFVLATIAANNQNFTFTNAMQSHGGGSFLKSPNTENTIILRLSAQNYYDETTIVLSEECSFNRDRKDGLKLYSFNSSVPQLYSISQDEINLAVNSIPNMNVETPVPLGIRIPKAESYTIGIQTNTSNFASNILYLEDKVLNKLHKISEEDYEFTSPQGTINNRFVLHMTDINDDDLSDMLNIWAYNNELFIISEAKQARLEIFDMQGRLISIKTININGKYSEMLKLQTGVYIVRLQNSNMVESKQIILE